MNLLTLLSFILLAILSGVIIIYLILLGMAPGVKPLAFTGFFLYGPGPGFFLLIGILILAIILQIFAWVLRNNQQGSRESILCNRISWVVLLLLLILEAVMIADFWKLF